MLRLCFRVLLGVACALSASAQMASLWFDPPIISRCTSEGLGRVAIAWTAPALTGKVQLRLLGVQGPAMTGWESSSGRAEAGDWVGDGMLFVLVDERGTALARGRAIVHCSNYTAEAPAQLSGGGYLPLQIGNRWIYRLNTRLSTADYLTMQVERAEILDGKTWYAVAVTSSSWGALGDTPLAPTYQRYRTTEDGRVYILSSRLDGSMFEQLWLDPTSPPDSSALLTLQGAPVPYRHALGTFTETVTGLGFAGLGGDIVQFARGAGIVARTRTMLSGSSGGLTEGWELVHASLGGRVDLGSPASGISVSVEDTRPNVSGGEVSNCAVPCYFAACGIAPGYDPPGTYKPCMQARVRLEEPALSAGDRTSNVRVVVEFLNSVAQPVYKTEHAIPASLIGDGWTEYLRLPLYSAPNRPIPAGVYTLKATAALPDNQVQSATVSIDVR